MTILPHAALPFAVSLRQAGIEPSETAALVALLTPGRPRSEVVAGLLAARRAGRLSAVTVEAILYVLSVGPGAQEPFQLRDDGAITDFHGRTWVPSSGHDRACPHHASGHGQLGV